VLFGQYREPQEKSAGQTDSLLSRGFWLGLAMLGVIAVYGLTLKGWPENLQFLAWGCVAAFASYLMGIALGMLFGLPTARGWTPRTVTNARPGAVGNATANNPATSTAGPATSLGTTTTVASAAIAVPAGVSALSEYDIPYDESTSLEQIADWLTKTIVGLTLTQFVIWRPYFERLAQYVSELMLGAGASLVAGGLLITGFTVLGFLTAYLWMRRYFISEMVVARRGAIDELLLERQAKAASAAAEAIRRAADERVVMLEKQLQEEKQRAALAAEQAITRAQTAAAEQAKALALADAKLQAERQAAANQAKAKANAYQVRPEGEVSPAAVDVAAYLSTAAAKMPNNEKVSRAIEEIGAAAGGAQPTYPDDPWRERFGSAPAGSGFTLSGEVTPVDENPDWFNVSLKVGANSERVRDLVAGKQSAVFFLHQTFGPEPRLVQFDVDGVAPLSLVAYGAFTVGVLLEDGTRLELNLAGIPSAASFPIFLER
jgi:hypothetical protein